MVEITDSDVVQSISTSLTGDANAASKLTAVVSAGQNTIVGRVAGEDLDALEMSEIPEADSEAGIFVIGFTADGNLARFPVEDGIPSDAPLLTSRASDALLAEVNLGALTTGILKHTVTAGVSVPATAVQNVDYAAAAHAARHGSAGADAITVAESQVTGLTSALAGKSATTHNHDSAYSSLGHNHDSAYAAKAGSIAATYCVYLSSDGSSMAAEGTQVVAFNAELAAVSGFSLSSGEVTLADPGKYEVDAHIEANGTTSNVKIGCPAVLQSDDSGGFATVAGASAYLSEAGASTNTDLQNVRTDIRWPVTTTGSNKKIRIYLGPSVAGTSALVCKANRCRMTVRKVAA